MDNFNHKYRKLMEEEDFAPNDVWDNISKQLDMDEVWDNIKNKLDEEDRALAWKRLITRSVALLLVLFSSIQLFDNVSKKANLTSSFESKNTIILPENEEIAINISLSDLNSTPNNQNIVHSVNENFSIGNHQLLTTENNFPKIQKISPKKIGVLPSLFSIKEVLIRSDIEKTNNETLNELPKSETNPKNFKISSVGINTTARNSWLLNQETFNGLNKEKINSAHFTLGKALGLEFGINYKNTKSTVQLFALSTKGQNYSNFVRGRMQEKNVQLNYYNLTFTTSIPCWQSEKSVALVGFYSGLLSNATINNIDLNEQLYRKMDFGLIIGKEYTVPLNTSMELATSIKFLYGLNNIYKGSSESSISLNKTRNSSLDLGISLRYLLK